MSPSSPESTEFDDDGDHVRSPGHHEDTEKGSGSTREGADEEHKHAWSVLPKLVALGDRERTRRLRRSLWTWLILVVLAVSAVGVVVNVLMVDHEPQDPVENWLESMVDGRSRQGLANFGSGSGYSDAQALPNRAYRAASGRIDRWEITDVRTHGDTAEVTARVWWAEGHVPEAGTQGEEHTWEVLQRRRTGPFNDSWELVDHEAATLSVSTPGLAGITINGVEQRLNPDDRKIADGTGGVWTWEALPGQFVVGLPEDGDYVLRDPIDPVTVALEDPSPREVEVAVEPSPSLLDKVDGAIKERIDACLSSKSVAPAGCPASARWAEGNVPNAQAPTGTTATPTAEGKASRLATPTPGTDVRDVEWELVSRPALWLVPDEDAGGPLDWKASEHNTAKARLSYLEDGERVQETVAFPIRVTVTSDGEDAAIQVRLD